jgi:hypothetical protein
LESETHVQREVSHFFLHHTQQQVDVFIIKNNFHTLMDIIIIDPTRIDMVQQTSTTTRVMTMVAQENTRSYIEQAPSDDFIPFVIETYGCLHSHFDSFLIDCA